MKLPLSKPIVIAAAAFLVSVGAGAAGRMLLLPAPEPVVSGPAPRGPVFRVPPKGQPRPAADPGPAATPGSAAQAGLSQGPAGSAEAGLIPAERPSATPATERPTPTPSSGGDAKGPGGVPSSGMEFPQMANVLRGVNAADAALFLSYLNDPQVVEILRSMTVKEAAAILHHFPTRRAEDLATRLMAQSPTEKP